jgi:hypothetical protein
MHHFLIAPAEEEHRLALELALPVLVALKYGDGCGPIRTVVENVMAGSIRKYEARALLGSMGGDCIRAAFTQLE